MRTARTLTVHGGGVCPGGCLPPWGWRYMPRGCLPGGLPGEGVVVCLGGSAWAGVCPGGGGDLPGGSAQGGVCQRGVCSERGSLLGGTMWPIPWCIWCYLYAASTPTETQHQCSCLYSAGPLHDGIPPTVDRMTHMCKNITFPQTLFAGGNYDLR